jgi:hypothetical protein
LWSYVLRPGIDSAIDATAGNGGDALALGRMLFSNHTTDNRSQLICIDIQEQACENTRKQLADAFPANLMDQNVQVLHTSHAPLPYPRDTSSVAVVVYNLGFLPQSPKELKTQSETTIASLADAALVVRIGGILSVMTYPRTNNEEALAVHAFLEGLALFTGQSDWREYIDQVDPENCRSVLLEQLERVWAVGDDKQTWRVHEHKKLGWIEAPILLIATRIK